MDAETFALRGELERLAHLHAILASYARRIGDEGEAWLATDDHTFLTDEANGSGLRVAVKTFLIDPEHVRVVPERKRQRLTERGLALWWERLQAETQELLDGSLVGSGNLIRAYDTLADSIDLARRRMEGVIAA